jgi:chemotaxis protein MotB
MTRKRTRTHVNHERWLVSYADFITLLFAFFVVLFASSQADKHKQAQVAAAVKAAFSQLGVFEPHAATPPLNDNLPASASLLSASMLDKAMASPVPSDVAEAQLKQHIDQMLVEQERLGRIAKESVTTYIGRDGLVISLHEAGFFQSGSAEINPFSIPTLLALMDTLPLRPVRVEGHTDDIPIHTAQYATNWELSTARASAIARFLIDHSRINPVDVSAAGYAEFHPLATNATAEGRAQNRRVDIILLTRPTPSR